MSKQIVSKNLSFDNFEEFKTVAMALSKKPTVGNLNFGGNFITEAPATLSIHLTWSEEETF